MEHEVIGALGKVCDFNFLQRVLLAGRCVFFYLGKLLYPAPLVFIYPRWTIATRDFLAYLYPASVLALGGILLGGSRRWGKFPFACFLFFIITISPALGFTNFYPMRFSFVADHFQYLAGLGVFALLGWGLSNALDLLGTPLASPGGMIVIGLLGVNLALATARAAGKYADPLRLWNETLAYNPDSAIAHHNAGIACSENNQWRDALVHLRTAEALDPSYPQTHLALAYFAIRAGRREDALHQYQEAIRLDIRDPQILKDYAALRGGARVGDPGLVHQ
jgi:tetratricopeptide (TPR) repeat protein